MPGASLVLVFAGGGRSAMLVDFSISMRFGASLFVLIFQVRINNRNLGAPSDTRTSRARRRRQGGAWRPYHTRSKERR